MCLLGEDAASYVYAMYIDRPQAQLSDYVQTPAQGVTN